MIGPQRNVERPIPATAQVTIHSSWNLVARIGRLASGAGRCRTTSPSLTLGPCRAVQSQSGVSPPHSEATKPGDHRVTNWATYDAGLRARGSLTVWFTPEAVAAWAAAPRTTLGGQPSYSDLAITTALTL